MFDGQVSGLPMFRKGVNMDVSPAYLLPKKSADPRRQVHFDYQDNMFAQLSKTKNSRQGIIECFAEAQFFTEVGNFSDEFRNMIEGHHLRDVFMTSTLHGGCM